MRWGEKYFKHSSSFNNPVVVPYLDKDRWSLYILENDTKFVTFLNVDIIVLKVFAQKNSHECGHQVVFNFKTYI
jgi:hypothetical protein